MKPKVSRGLLVEEEWIKKILGRRKTWEIRSLPTHIRERVALIKTGSWMILGTCKIVNCKVCTIKQLKRSFNKHQIAADRLRKFIKKRKKGYAWILASANILKNPIPLRRKKGARKWVKLSNYISKEIERQS